MTKVCNIIGVQQSTITNVSLIKRCSSRMGGRFTLTIDLFQLTLETFPKTEVSPELLYQLNNIARSLIFIGASIGQ